MVGEKSSPHLTLNIKDVNRKRSEVITFVTSFVHLENVNYWVEMGANEIHQITLYNHARYNTIKKKAIVRG